MSSQAYLNNNMDIEDLPYVERDLNFAQKVSLAFLLFGDNHSSASYILQKLLAMTSHATSQPYGYNSDFLRQYAKTNPTGWRGHIIESLTIINARSVLRKLGFKWQELHLDYLPHITAITVHIHPLLKALYNVCEQLSFQQTFDLVQSINEKLETRHTSDRLQFHKYFYLEIFLLDWLTRRYIQLGDINAEGSDMQLLIEYFKYKDMGALASVLIDTINSNATDGDQTPMNYLRYGKSADAMSTSNAAAKTCTTLRSDSQPEHKIQRTDAFSISRENAGIVLIINQHKFHRDVTSELIPLLPKVELQTRQGTEVDKNRLRRVFSSFGYTVETHDNLDHLEVLSRIREAAMRSLLRDSLIVCILSHGFKDAVYGSNSIALKISDIENVLCANEDLGLKPKMLIVQACQQSDDKLETHNVNTSTKSPVQHVNLLKAMSTVPGFVAMRHTSEGSWFIQTLCEVIENRGKKDHLLNLMTYVIRLVSVKRGQKNEKMVPIINSTLGQNFYLPLDEQ